MKKVLLAVALCVASTFTFAQQGVMEIGGSLGINTTKTEQEAGDISEETGKTFGFSILPSLMYYVTDNIAVGGHIGFSYDKDDHASLSGLGDADRKTSIFEVAPTVRYKKELGAGFSWAPEFYIGFSFGSDKYEAADGDGEVKGDLFGMNVGIHFARFEYAVADKWVLSANFGNLGYEYGKTKIDDWDTSVKANNFGLSLLEDTNVGIAYRF
ncbi:MAG: outer membrane beta-barrel protein [Bacteroidaceae bacterium]|jgi:hypothetical protein